MELSIFDRQIEEYCEKNQISGMLRITVKDHVLFEKSIGFADREKKIPFTAESMFTLYSLSKPFCAIGLLLLKDKGLVDLSAHPSAYLPEAAGFHPQVTMRQILNHTSGLPDFELNKEFAARYAHGYAHEVREQLKSLTLLPSHFAPGEKTMYANINFILCALVIESVTGEKYADYMAREVFAPLGMKTAVVDDEKKVIPHRVTGYTLENDVPVPTPKSHDWMFGAGDIVATVDDVYCLNKAIKCKLLLSESTWEEALTPSSVGYFGYGCSLLKWHGKTFVRHNGGHTGFRSLHAYVPQDDFDMIFLSNSGYGVACREDLMEIAHSAFYGEDGGELQHLEMDAGYAKP